MSAPALRAPSPRYALRAAAAGAARRRPAHASLRAMRSRIARRIAALGLRPGRPLHGAGLAAPAGRARRLRAVGGAQAAANASTTSSASSRSSSPSLRDRVALAELRAPRLGLVDPDKVRSSSSDDGAARPPRARRWTAGSSSLAVRSLLLVRRAVDLTVLRGPDFARQAAGQHRQRDRARAASRARSSTATASCSRSSVDVPVDLRPSRASCGARSAGASPRWRAALRLQLARRREAADGDAALRVAQAPGVAARAGGRGRASASRRRGSSRSRGASIRTEQLAAHVLGFVGIDSQGLAGLERALRPRDPRRRRVRIEVDRDARGREFLRTALTDAGHAGQSRRAHARRRASRTSRSASWRPASPARRPPRGAAMVARSGDRRGPRARQLPDLQSRTSRCRLGQPEADASASATGR